MGGGSYRMSEKERKAWDKDELVRQDFKAKHMELKKRLLKALDANLIPEPYCFKFQWLYPDAESGDPMPDIKVELLLNSVAPEQ